MQLDIRRDGKSANTTTLHQSQNIFTLGKPEEGKVQILFTTVSIGSFIEGFSVRFYNSMLCTVKCLLVVIFVMHIQSVLQNERNWIISCHIIKVNQALNQS